MIRKFTSPYPRPSFPYMRLGTSNYPKTYKINPVNILNFWSSEHSRRQLESFMAENKREAWENKHVLPIFPTITAPLLFKVASLRKHKGQGRLMEMSADCLHKLTSCIVRAHRGDARAIMGVYLLLWSHLVVSHTRKESYTPPSFFLSLDPPLLLHHRPHFDPTLPTQPPLIHRGLKGSTSTILGLIK